MKQRDRIDIHYVNPSDRDDSASLWPTEFDEEIALFKQQAAGLAAISDRAGLRDLYGQWVAYLLARHRGDEAAVMLTMRQALREVLLQPSCPTGRNRFGDL